jgi:hypothetical protein
LYAVSQLLQVYVPSLHRYGYVEAAAWVDEPAEDAAA